MRLVALGGLTVFHPETRTCVGKAKRARGWRRVDRDWRKAYHISEAYLKMGAARALVETSSPPRHSFMVMLVATACGPTAAPTEVRKWRSCVGVIP